jgi:hypothetical protein
MLEMIEIIMLFFSLSRERKGYCWFLDARTLTPWARLKENNMEAALII